MSQFTDSLFSENYQKNNNSNNFSGNFSNFNTNVHKNELNNGLIWFIVILPFFGLFMENSAINKIAGIFLWVIIIISMPLCCYLDCRKLESAGMDVSGIKNIFFIPPLYLNKRDALFNRDSFRCILVCIGIAFALFFNGFTQSLFLSEDKIQTVVQNTSVTSLDNFSGNSDNGIGDQTEKYFGKSAEWSAQKTNYGFDVVCKGIHQVSETEIHFKVSHDGFCYQGIKVDDILVNGEKVDKNTKKKLLREIFIPETIKTSTKSNTKNA